MESPEPRGAVCVIAESGQRDPKDNKAQVLAEHLGLSFLQTPPEHGLVLVYSHARLELRDADNPATRPIYVDFHSEDIQRRLRAGKRGNLARAIGLAKRPNLSVFDATCGLARDSAVLMGLGCRVQACERQPILQCLIEDGLRRAGPLEHWQGLLKHDAAQWLSTQSLPVADVIYMDPMFGGNRNALPKWEMQALHEIAGADADAASLLTEARQHARQRVVVKRHPRGPELAPPDLQIRGKRSRFDIYLVG